MNKNLYKEIGKLKILSENEILELIQNYKAGDESNLSKIIESNLKLIVFFAKKYYHQIKDNELIDEDDLIAEGSFAVKSAVENFNPNLNIKFSYYLSIWIKKQISEFLINALNTIKLPINKFKKNESIIKLIQKEFQESESEIEKYQLEEMNVPKHQIDFYFDSKISFTTYDENENISEEKDNDDDDATMDTIENIQNQLNKLTDNEKTVITLTFGINKPKAYKSIEVAQMMNISRQYVVQIKRNAINKLKLKLK